MSLEWQVEPSRIASSRVESSRVESSHSAANCTPSHLAAMLSFIAAAPSVPVPSCEGCQARERGCLTSDLHPAAWQSAPARGVHVDVFA